MSIEKEVKLISVVSKINLIPKIIFEINFLHFFPQLIFSPHSQIDKGAKNDTWGKKLGKVIYNRYFY